MRLNNISLLSVVAKGLACLVVWVSLTACNGDGSNNIEVNTESDVVVTVSGTPITQNAVDYARQKFFGGKFVDARAERNIVESLISSRSIAKKAESSLSEDALSEIDIAVAAYKEELLIKYLIESSTMSEPVSAAEVEEYYRDHSGSFGASDRKIVDVAKATFSKESRLSVLATMNEIQSGDWNNKYSGFHNFQTYASALNGKLGTQIESLDLGESTGVVVIGSEAYVARLASVEKIPAQPLADVGKEIRKRLAARKLSKKIRELSDQARSEVEIVWMSE
tara:strand:+ start:1065 stop:1904 length:840 start_codon:yes stop_codon:yes gene_type:complete